MCGIIGALPAIEETRLRAGMNGIAHRGPDGAGYWNDDKAIQLGHRRLSILDLTDAGHQPMEFEDYCLVFNGEIYNYIEVRNELMSHGYTFHTASDTEVLLKAFDKWKADAFHKFNGMWAVAIYNRKEQSLYLCRDRYGKKPLYYYWDHNQLIFASEVQAIHKVLGRNHPLNNVVLQSISKGQLHWHGGDQTYLQNVYILPAGHSLEFSSKALLVRRWYELVETSVPKTLDEQAEQLKSLIESACSLRLRSDVPIGTCLSGGLDSSALTAVINKMSDEFGNYTHRSFCASFPGASIDESAKAKRLAAQLGSKLDVVDIHPPSSDELELAMKSCDGPMHALAFFPIWKLYKHIREQGIIVTLDGQGPDEMLGGYRPVPAAIRTALRSRDFRWLKDIYSAYSAQGESREFSARATTAKLYLHTLLISGISRKNKTAQHPYRDTALDEELYQQFFVQPLPGILQQYDRCSMASGVECRMPFMDYRIVEFVFSLPPKSKVGNGYTKLVLREAVKGILPDETRLDRQKIGFNAPIVDWYRGPLKQWMLDIMSSQSFLDNDVFDGKIQRKRFEKFLTSSYDWREAWSFWGGVHFAWWKDAIKKYNV